jgi:hypothetical protein
MSIFLLKFLGAAAGIASMTAAVDRGDLDEAARQGALAGPRVVTQALRSKTRATVLAGIVAAPVTEDRAELLPVLAQIAGGGDRRTSIPAARAALTIAESLAKKDLADDIAADDVQTWRAAFEALALTRGRVIEVRVAALETAAALEHVVDPTQNGFDLARVMSDRDPLLRVAGLELIPRPTPASLRVAIVPALADSDPAVVLAAAQTLCADFADDPDGIKTALGADGLAQIKAIVKAHPNAIESRDGSRCLK